MGAFRFRKLRVLIAAALIFVQFPRQAGAGGELDLGGLSALSVLTLELVFIYNLNWSHRSDIWNTDRSVHSRDIYELVYDSTAFAIDHIALANSDKASFDYTGKVTNLYSTLSSAGELSFGDGNFILPARSVAALRFNNKNPGYDDLPGLGKPNPLGIATDYPKANRNRIDEVRTYVKGVASGVRSELEMIGTASADIDKLNKALYGYIDTPPAYDSIISGLAGLMGGGSLASLAAAAAEAAAGSGLPLTGKAYRGTMQAANRAANYNNVILSKLRVDVMRQVEAETQLALYAQQERTVVQAAFEQAVKEWTVVSSDVGY
ncbi:hypothetical protein AGMMS49957_14570 [Synergistales bacterium]|nr:hypothetical protein AGMMS49957_14570 [Synergistales bacterium]